MSIMRNNKVVATSETLKGYHPPILSCMWSDHIINDIQWLRADTFSWQSGDVYKTVYDELKDDWFEVAGTTPITETISGITISYWRTPKGYKIINAGSQTDTRVQWMVDLFNATGVAWFYLLDTPNKRFKLPRTKFGFEGLRTNVGDDIAESLPNIKGNVTIRPAGNATGAAVFDYTGAVKITHDASWTGYLLNTSSGGTQKDIISIDASRSSSTYQDNAPVQERATQMYLYFYVGEYTQTAIEQTAGLNSELFNGKQDVNTCVLKTGDIMSGTLETDVSTEAGRGINVKSTYFNQLENVAYNKASAVLDFTDNQNRLIGRIINYKLTDGGSLFGLQHWYDGQFASDFYIGRSGGKVYYSRPQIITDYINGTSGYRIWSNGYCEQWGRISASTSSNWQDTQSIGFVKTFANTDYQVYLAPFSGSFSAGSSRFTYTVTNPTTSSCSIRLDGQDSRAAYVNWKVSGYLASNQY